MSRLAATLTIFVLTWIALLPSALSLSQHGDERQYAWSAGYFGGLLARGEFRSLASTPAFSDPAWDPLAWWNRTQPTGARLLYAAALGLTRSVPPSEPYSYGLTGGAEWVGPASMIPSDTLLVLRGAAVLAAAAGLSLITLRFGWRGAAACGSILLIPHVRDDLARAWAEGPLLLGIGICAAAYGTRWFGPACGVAATFKLTAMGLWPLLLVRGPRRMRVASFCAATLIWILLTPPSWFAGGPAFIGTMVRDRFDETPSHVIDGTLENNAPTRYLWPFELAAAVGLSCAAMRVYGSSRPRLRAASTFLTKLAPQGSRS
jgi:hypothetical protein